MLTLFVADVVAPTGVFRYESGCPAGSHSGRRQAPTEPEQKK
jgi:hypothetical protein